MSIPRQCNPASLANLKRGNNPGPHPGSGRYPIRLKEEALYELCEPLPNDDGQVMTSNQMASWIMRNHPDAMVRLAAKRTLMEAAQHNKTPPDVVIDHRDVIDLMLIEMRVAVTDHPEAFEIMIKIGERTLLGLNPHINGEQGIGVQSLE